MRATSSASSSHRARDRPRRAGTDEVLAALEQTIGFWRSWLAGSTYEGRWREIVNRSAITLKLLTYAPTGALIAAATAGLPEQLGGERNWDYRYTWIRDSSFSVRALLGLGFTEEAARLVAWVGERAREAIAGDDATPLKIMYRVDGSSDLVEETLDHLERLQGLDGRCGSATGPPTNSSSTSTASSRTAPMRPTGSVRCP